MTIAQRGLKVKVMGQADVVGPTSIEGSFSSYVKTISSNCRYLFSYLNVCDCTKYSMQNLSYGNAVSSWATNIAGNGIVFIVVVLNSQTCSSRF